MKVVTKLRLFRSVGFACMVIGIAMYGSSFFLPSRGVWELLDTGSVLLALIGMGIFLTMGDRIREKRSVL